jgi:hypothetical protein
MSRFQGVLVGRVLFAIASAACSMLVAVHVYRTIDRNAVLSRELIVAQGEVNQLLAKRAEQLRAIRRLSDPIGAIPEIHERLQMHTAHEQILFLQRASSPQPQAP